MVSTELLGELRNISTSYSATYIFSQMPQYVLCSFLGLFVLLFYRIILQCYIIENRIVTLVHSIVTYTVVTLN